MSDNDVCVYLELQKKNIDEGFKPHSSALATGGSFILFCNWLILNATGTKSITVFDDQFSCAKGMLLTILAGSAGFFTTLVL